MTDYPTVPSGAIDAIAYGYHGDPFSILGAHAVENGMVIRTFHAQHPRSKDSMAGSIDIRANGTQP